MLYPEGPGTVVAEVEVIGSTRRSSDYTLLDVATMENRAISLTDKDGDVKARVEKTEKVKGHKWTDCIDETWRVGHDSLV